MEKKISLEKEKGIYICTCGSSKTIPICDGSHKGVNVSNGSNFKPVKVTSNEDVDLSLESGGWPGDAE